MSENQQQLETCRPTLINNRSQGSVATFITCGANSDYYFITNCYQVCFERVFNKRELTFTFAVFTFAICCRPSVCMSYFCLSSVTLVHPTQAVVNFGNFLRRLVPWPFYGDRPRGTPPLGELNPRGVAKYSDFGPIEGYISETVQDISYY